VNKKWFNGEIVENLHARAAVAKQLAPMAQETGMTLPVEGVKSGIYGLLSQYSHVSYGAILEEYAAYDQDFDFERIAGHHYALYSSLGYVQTEIEGVIVTLKGVYKMMGDQASFGLVNALLKKYAPHMFDKESMKKGNAALVARYSKSDGVPQTP